MADDSLALIRRRLAEIKIQVAQLQSEEAELTQAERTIVRLAHRPVGAHGSATTGAPELRTQRDYVIHALKTSEDPWFPTSRALRDKVAELGRDIPMSSFQPLVSQMTSEEILRRDEGKVGLAERVD